MTNKPMLSVARVHRLKIHRKPFLDLESGAKTCEIRDCSDRDFQVGDSVLLMLVDETGNPTPNELRRKITHIQTGYGLPDDFCVLSYEPATKHQGEPIGFRYRTNNGPWEWMDESPFSDGRHHYKNGHDELEPMFSEHPAPVAVVIPERREPSPSNPHLSDADHEYNNALDDVAKLNGVKP